MLDNTHQIIAGVVLLTVIGIAYGGTFLLRVFQNRVPSNDLQKSFFRAGHAHAGVLVILGLLVMTLTQLNGVGQPWATLSFGVLSRGGHQLNRGGHQLRRNRWHSTPGWSNGSGAGWRIGRG